MSDAVSKLKVLFEADSSALDKAFGDTSSKAKETGERVKQAFSEFGGEKLAAEASGIAKEIEKIGGISKLTESELKKVKVTTDEAVAKFKALGKDVPPDIARLSDEIAHATRGMSALGNEAADVDKKAGGLAGMFGKATGAVGGLVSGLGSIGLAAGGLGVITDTLGSAAGAITGLIGSAEALGDAQARVGLVFGESAGAVEKAAASQAAALGMTRQAFLDAAGAQGQLLTSMGVGNEAAADMASTLTDLAPKLAAYAGVDTATATAALEKGLTGATKGLKEMGIVVADLPEGLDAAGKAQAIFGQIMDQSGNAIAAWADNSGDVEVSLQRVSAAVEEAKTSLGEKLLPLVAPIAEAFASALPGALDALVSAVGPVVDAFVTFLVPAIQDGVANIKSFIADLQQKWDDDWGGIRSAVEDVMGWWEANVAPVLEEDLQTIKDAIAEFGTKWDTEWKGKIEPAVRGFIEFWKSTVAPALSFVFELWRVEIEMIGAVIGTLAEAWRRHGDSIMAIVGPIVAYVVQQFQYLMDFVRGIVQAGSALIQGDFRGFGEGLGKAAAAAVNFIVNVFKTTWSLVRTALSNGVAGIVSWLKGQGDSMGKMTLDGLIEGIKSGAGRVYAALKEIASGMVKGFMDNLVMHSPSKVFEQLGQWITMGLASGIQKEDQKAIAALADIVSKMTSVANGLADFGKKIAEMVVPTDQQIASAKEKYLRMTMILTDFVKDISYLGSLLPVSNVGMAGPGQIRAINAGLVQLSQSFPAIKELQGMTADKLLTGGEASWASQLADTVGKISSVWGGIADSMTKIADAKFPSDTQLDAVKAATLKIAMWATGVFDQDIVSSLGAEEFAKSIKAMVDAFNAVASAKLDDVTRVGADVLQTAKDNILDMWAGFEQISRVFRGLESKTQDDIVSGFTRFGAAAKAATDAITAGAMSKFEGATRLGADAVRIAKANILDMWLAVADISKVFRALETDMQQGIVDGFKRFSDAVGAVVSILKASEIGEIVPAISINVDMMVRVLEFVRDKLAPTLQDIAGAWTLGVDAADHAIANMKQFSDWISAAVAIAKATVIGELHAHILVNFDVMQAILVWLRDKFVPMVADVVGEWGLISDGFRASADKMKQFAEWVNAAAAIAKATVIGELHANILVNFDVMKAILVWLRDKFVPDLAEIVSLWGGTVEDTKPMVDKMKAFADLIGAAAGLAKSADVGALANATSPANMADKLAIVKANILAVYGMLTDIAKDITVEDATARAALATALGGIGGGLGDFGGGIGGIMDLVQSRLFGSDASRGGLGHTQRTRTNRADFFAQQLTDTIKRAVGAVQDALGGISLNVDDAKVAALAALGDAFGKIAEGLTKLAEAKLPDAKQLAAIMSAMTGGQNALLGGAGTGGGGGPMTLNLSNPSLVFATPITASVQVTTTPTIMIGHATIETLATMIETKLAEKFTIGAGGGGSPITTGGERLGSGQAKGGNDINPNRRSWG